uniref:Cytosolic endo-beta-N-acetylglucosaminidase-like n=1 Tax=Rhizophora mucronata TaxID=61149 RepID=A0A2P2KK71_RHIMU
MISQQGPTNDFEQFEYQVVAWSDRPTQEQIWQLTHPHPLLHPVQHLYSIVHHHKCFFQIHLFPCKHRTFYHQLQRPKVLDSCSSMCSSQKFHHMYQRKVYFFHSVDFAI